MDFFFTKRRVAVWFSCLAFCSVCAGETTLRKGDAAIVGLDTIGESFTCVLLADIAAGTVIFFSDNDVVEEGSDTLAATEGVLKYIAPSALPRGTVLRFEESSPDFSTVKGRFALANNGDNLVCFQGFDSTSNRAGRFLHAVGKRGRQTRPAGLDEGDMVLWDRDDGEYEGVRAGTREDLFAEINRLSNWKTYADFSGVLDASAFQVADSGPMDDPSLHVLAALDFGSVFADAASTRVLAVRNTGEAAALTIQAATGITGPDHARFHLDTPLPAEIPAGGTLLFTVRFFPAGKTGTFQAALDMHSNDPGNPLRTVALSGAALEPPDYGTLRITEVISRPTPDECVEIFCDAPSTYTLDLSGVVLSDEDDSNTEGALIFPPGSVIQGGEVILAAVGASALAPSWLGSLPPGVRVFYEPSRDAASWEAPAANPLVPLLLFPTAQGGTSGKVSLSDADGVALYRPGVVFLKDIGPSPVTACIDGMNYNSSSASPANPIHPSGLRDTASTRAGAGEAAEGYGFSRLYTSLNTASDLLFLEVPINPGYFVPGAWTAARLEWALYP